MKVKIKKLRPDGIIPEYSRPGDAGLDLYATSKELSITYVNGARVFTYGTSLAFEIPEGYVGLLFSRSSIYKTSLMLCNAVGVLDSSFRGEVKLKFRLEAGSRPHKDCTYNVGDRIGQLIIMPYPQIEFEEVDELSNTDRGEGGFGSTGA